ncbi:hypothetical protein MRX96_035066 [Rhipicephalus microplus]
MAAISARIRVPSPRNMLPGTSSGVESAPIGHVAEQYAPFECEQMPNNGGRCQKPEAVLGTRSTADETPRRLRPHELCREVHMSPHTPPLTACMTGARHVSEPQGGDQEQPRNDRAISRTSTSDLFAAHEPNSNKPQIEREPRVPQGHFREAPAAKPASFTWRRDVLLALWLSCTSTSEYEEVFSPALEISEYQVKFYARCASKDGCAVFSFCAQVCASIRNGVVPWPFRGTLRFTIHHPTCSTKSRIYIVPTLQERRNVAGSDVGKTLFRLTGPIPALALYNEGFLEAGSLRLSIKFRA